MPSPDARTIPGWSDQVADKIESLSGLDAKLRELARVDLAYRSMYNQVRTTLDELEAQLRSPPVDSLRVALAAFWNAEDSWVPEDLERMRRAMVSGVATLLARVETVQRDRGIREFSFREVQAGVDELQRMCAPGSAGYDRAEKVIHRLLRAISNANVASR